MSFSWRTFKLEKAFNARCAECTLLDQPGPCPGEGNKDAKIIYIAQNPGQNEVAARPMRPLVGPSGHTFNRQCSEAGVSRDEIYITNQVKCLTPANRTPTDHEVACCKPILESEMARTRADTVVLAGAVSFKANINNYSTYSPSYKPTDNVMARMGCVEQKDGRKWIGTIHPAFVMRMPDYREEAVWHLRKARQIAGQNIPLVEINEHPTDQEVYDYALEAQKAGRFADDVETEQSFSESEDDYVGGDYKLTMCGFSVRPYHAIVGEPEQLHLWSSTWGDPRIVQFEHNGEYDRYHLERIAPQSNRRFDTMMASHLLRSYMRKALKPAVLSHFTNLPYYNRDIGKDKGMHRFYCGLDNITTLLAGLELWRRIRGAM